MKSGTIGLLVLMIVMTLPAASSAEAFNRRAQPALAAPVPIELIAPAASDEFWPYDFVSLGEQTFFVENDAVHGYELWRTDGTSAGTGLVMDLNPGAADGSRGVMAHGERLFFAGNDGTHGLELWVSDGTAAGSHMVTDILTGSAGALEGGYYAGPVAAGDAVFFIANDGVHGRELWRTDGTAAGTARVTDLPDDSGWGPGDLTALGDIVFFTAPGADGRQIWRTDGTPAGTERLGNLLYPEDLVVVGDRLYFVAIDGTNRVLWWSDATAEVHSTGISFGQPPFPTADLISAGGVLYILSNWAKYQCLLSSPTWDFNSFCGPQFGLGPHSPTDIDGTVFFSAGELWRVRPGEEEPTIALDINPGAESNPESLMAIRGTLYFVADDGAHGREIWQSNPITGQTSLFADVVPGAGSLRPQLLYANGSTLFFRVFDSQSNNGLWAVSIPETANSRLYLPLISDGD